jgi:hypothetical protein
MFSGWLHKGIRSQNIAFFDREASFDRNIPSLDKPQVLGFEYSRLDISTAFTNLGVSSDLEFNRYRHPQVQSNGCSIYSPSIALLEIGYTIDIFHRDLLRFHIPRLGAEAGTIYMGIVAKCVGRDFCSDVAKLQQKFYWNVVRGLSQLVV